MHGYFCTSSTCVAVLLAVCIISPFFNSVSFCSSVDVSAQYFLFPYGASDPHAFRGHRLQDATCANYFSIENMWWKRKNPV